MEKRLQDKRVLIVEDDPLIVMILEDMLNDLGAVPAASAFNVADAISKIENESFDVALLDLNLGGTKSFPVAQALADRGVPFVFASGYGASGVIAEYSECPLIPKPFEIEDVAKGLVSALTMPRRNLRPQSGIMMSRTDKSIDT